MKWIHARLREPSTWAAFGAFLVMLAFSGMVPGRGPLFLAAGICELVGVVLPERHE